MDQAVSILQSIYDVYKTIKDGQDAFHATYRRLKDLLGQLQTMQDTDTLVQSRLLDKYFVIARDFKAYLDKYNKRKFISKVFHQSDMLAEIEGFNQELEALFQLFHLAMGSHVVEHNRTQEASIDELVRGMRVLLQGSMTGNKALKSEQSSDDLLPAAAAESTGAVAKAKADGDIATLLKLLVDSADTEQAAFALFELADDEATRDAMVHAGAVPVFIQALRTPGSLTIRMTIVKTLHRLAVRDVHEVALVEAGGIDVLSAMLLSPNTSEDEVTAASAALANVVFQPEHKLIVVKTPNVINKLVELVRSGSSSQKKHASNTLRELAANDECAVAINDAGGITALVDMLHIGTPELCACSLAALWNLSSLEQNRTEIAAVGGINAIVAQIRRGATDDQRQLAASALAILAQDDANDALIGAAGGVELLVTLLQTGTDGQKNSAAWALAELANNKDNATAMLQAGVAPALMAAFRSGSDIQRAKAGLALVWIAELVEDISTLADEIGASSIVSLLRGSADQRQHAASILASMAAHGDLQTKLGELGAIELLVDLARKYTPKTGALKALSALAAEHEVNQERVGRAGGIEATVSILSTVPFGDESCGENEVDVVATLETIAQSSDLRQAVIGAGGVPLLLKALNNGNILQQRSAAALLAYLVDELPDEDACEPFNDCVKAFTVKLATDRTDLDDEIFGSILNGLMGVVLRANGCAQFVNHANGISILTEMLPHVKSDALRRDMGFVLANIGTHEEYRDALGNAGVLAFFSTSLNSKDEDVQIMAAYGVSQLSVSQTMCQRMMGTRGLCRRIVKLLEVAGTDDAKHRIAETIWNLSTHRDIAAELGQMHGLDELVTLVQEGTDIQAYAAMMALASLSALEENIDVLTEIGGVDAAVSALENEEYGDIHDTRLAAFQLLSNMPANREAGERMISSGVIAHCVSALQAEDNEWKQYGLTILDRLNGLANVDASESSSDDEDEDGYDEEGGDEDGENEEDEYNGEGEDEEDDGTSVIAQIRDAGGIEPLVEMLEDPEAGNHTAIIKLLDALAGNDESSKRKIGGCLSVLIESVREASAPEQEAAASAIVTLLEGSKRNVATAIRSRMVDAFLKLLGSDVAVESLTSSFAGLLIALKPIKSTESNSAMKKITQDLVKAAAEDEGTRGEASFKVLQELITSSGCVKTVVDAGATLAFANVIKEALQAGQTTRTSLMERAASILAAIADTTSGPKLFSSGAIDAVFCVFQDAPADCRCDIATIVDNAARSATTERDALVSGADVLLEMLRHGTVKEQAAASGAISSMTYDTPWILAKFPRDELLELCSPLLNASDEVARYQGLRLVASLASNKGFGEEVVRHKTVLQRSVELLFDDFEYKIYALWAAEELASYGEGRACLVDAGAEKRLIELREGFADHDQIPSSCERTLARLAAPAS